MLDKALNTYGWMEPEQLLWLRNQAREFRRVIEVGSYMGRSTLALAEGAEFVIAVDNWEGPKEIYVDPEERKNCFQKFLENLHDYIEAGQVIVLKVNCRELAVDLLPKQPPFDMVFIDSDHSYEACKQDIRFWRPLIRVGGLICGHDYIGFPEVAKAVDAEFVDVQQPVSNLWAVML